MNNVLIGMDESNSFRFYLTITTDLVRRAREIHDLSPLATAGLGRVLTGTGLMSLMMKSEKDRLTVRFFGDGPAGQIMGCGYGDGRVRGLIGNPQVDLPLTPTGKLDVGGSLGEGNLTVIRDSGQAEPYVGTIALTSGEIAEDLTAYYYISEQQNTSIALGVKVNRADKVLAAGGMFIQMLPGAREETVEQLEKLLAELPPITTCIEETMLAGGGAGEEVLLRMLMERIFASLDREFAPRVLEYGEIRWECDCSKERMGRALVAIGAKELTTLIEEDGRAELGCQFCKKKYRFTKEELEDLREQAETATQGEKTN